MIGSKMSSMLLDGAELTFYKYDKDLKALLESVRETLNRVADTWTREQKDHCLQETQKSFQVIAFISVRLLSFGARNLLYSN